MSYSTSHIQIISLFPEEKNTHFTLTHNANWNEGSCMFREVKNLTNVQREQVVLIRLKQAQVLSCQKSLVNHTWNTRMSTPHRKKSQI